MKQFIHENRRMLILTALALLAGILIGFSIAITAGVPDAAETGTILGTYISPDANVHSNLTFSRCEHHVQLSLDPERFTGQSQDEFLKMMPEVSLNHFTSKNVVFTKHIEGVCSAHYLMLLNSNRQITVQKFDETELEMKDAATIGIPFSMVDPILLNELEDGIVFSSMDEINRFLENAES